MGGTSTKVKARVRRVKMAAKTRRRKTKDTTGYEALYGLTSLWNASPRPDRTRDWRDGDLNNRTLSWVTTDELLELLGDVSAEFSNAMWHFLRFCNPGVEIHAFRPGTEELEPRGEAALKEFLELLTKQYGAFNVVISKMFTGAFLRGAFFNELVLGDGGRMIDLIAIDPAVAEYKLMSDGARGEVWVLGQTVGDTFKRLDKLPTVAYVPVDPYPGGPPFGRSLSAPAIFSSLFLIGLLQDLRRVVSQQGYPRIDVGVNMEKLANAMPDGERDDPDAFAEWVEAVIDEVERAYSSLEPDDAFIHTDAVEVNGAVGAIDTNSLGGVSTLVNALTDMVIRGLKTMPIVMGVRDGMSESASNRQWEIHAQGIKALQHLAETCLNSVLTTGLNAMGIQAEARVKLAELRASEQLRDAQTENMKIVNAAAKYQHGWISQDEAAYEITGHEADQEEPRGPSAEANAPNSMTTYPDASAAGKDNKDEPLPEEGDSEGEEP